MSGSSAQQNQFIYYKSVKQGHFWLDTRVMCLLSLLERQRIRLQGLRGLEVGCGNGLLVSQLERTLDCTMDGVDIHDVGGRPMARGRFETYDIAHRDPRKKGTYDFVVIFDVLEHIPEPEKFLADIAYHLKPGGHLFVNVPAFRALYSRYDAIAGHLRRYTIGMLRGELERSKSFRLLGARYWGFFFLPLVVLRKILLATVYRNRSDQAAYDAGFVPPAKLVNSALTQVGGMEAALPFAFPLGTSVMAAAKSV